MIERWERERLARLAAERMAEDITRELWLANAGLKEAEQRLAILNQSLEQEVEAQLHEIKARNSELQSFAQTVAHDLKSPLSAINLKAALIQQAWDHHEGGALQQHIDSIYGVTRNIREFIDNLLEYARAGSEAQAGHVDLSRLVHEVVAVLRGQLGEAKVEIGWLPVVRGYEVLLRQLFQNLLVNCVKYADPARGLRIEIGVMPGDSGLDVYILDNGRGFEKEVAASLFQSFKRHHHDVPGHGIGLATCARVAMRHGGSIMAEPGPDNGACFRLHLPADILLTCDTAVGWNAH